MQRIAEHAVSAAVAALVGLIVGVGLAFWGTAPMRRAGR